MIAKFYESQPLHKLNPEQTAREVGEKGVVVIRDSGATPAEYAAWTKEYGYYLSPNIWCTDKDHDGVFWRVTNQFVDEKNKGLVGDHELDWHCNITPVLDGEELVGLYAKTITYETETWFCNSIPYWQTLSESEKSLYRSLTIVLDPKRRLGRIQPGWEPNWEKIYSQQIIQDIYKNRRTREISQSQNMDEADRHLFPKSRGVIEDARLVPDHPLGTEGIFFTPYEVHGFKRDGKPYPDSAELYWKIWNDWVASERYTYKHKWKAGDIVLMDQLLTIHRRPSIDPDQPRELLRTACWYKKANRRHFGYAL